MGKFVLSDSAQQHSMLQHDARREGQRETKLSEIEQLLTTWVLVISICCFVGLCC
jgi:hypothetical protein